MRGWLKGIRLSEGMTMLKVAEKVHITESYYSMIESGKRGTRPALAKKISEALNFEKHGITWTKFFEEVA